jgi:hypothetical protein
MKFEDAFVVKLATPGVRETLFDDAALEQFIASVYDTSFVSVQGPFQAVFDELQLGMSLPRTGTADGEWGFLGSSEKTALNLKLNGASGDPVQVDAFWRGFIVTRSSQPAGVVKSVSTSLPDPSAIDAAILQALGALPAGAALEQERRARLTAMLKGAVGDPAIVTDAEIDRLLSSAGAASVGDYFDRVRGEAVIGTIKVAFEEKAAPPPAPRPLPIAAAILVRDGTFSVRELLAESRSVRDQLENAGLGRAEGGLRRLRDLLVIWVVPATVFDDADWPMDQQGVPPDGRRDARRTTAAKWLADQGIGLAAIA